MQPWLNPFNTQLCRAILASVHQGGDCLGTLNSQAQRLQLHNAQGLALRFVPQAQLPAGMAYERFIYDTGCVPTRTLAGSNGAMHDACNALMWLHYPRTKAQLNALQAAAMRAAGIRGTRGALRDALTLFDESALILCCPAGDAAPQQLAQRQWQTLLHTRRSDWHSVIRPFLFGHALLQKLQTPYPAITAQVWVQRSSAADLPSIDHALAASLSADLSPSDLLPLPVLGVAHWCDGNETAGFYADTQVFRPLAAKAGV